MIELMKNKLRFSFPEVHPDASMTLEFQRTLRLPDDDKTYPLPPGLGAFPLKHVDDFADKLPPLWKEHGGVMLPMFQSEAMWINFTSKSRYPFLVKIATGKINAVTGEEYRPGANRDPQDYLVVPTQPWLDGYCYKKGEVRQFVAMPLGAGYSVEEQLTGKAEHGGIQIQVFPLKAEAWRKRQKLWENEIDLKSCSVMPCISAPMDMGLAPGGSMKQEIYDDPHSLDDWDLRHSSRCFAHIANSVNWRAITGEAPPTIPPTAAQYSKAGLPWFDYYGEGQAVEGADTFQGVKTVKEKSAELGVTVLPENETTEPEQVIGITKPPTNVVREGDF